MGFKRTPEGRVFFSGADQDNQEADRQDESPKRPVGKAVSANDEPPKPQSAARLRQEQPTGPSQMQIVTLLKTLNERLKITQSERDKMMRELENYRGIIENLEDKTERNERIALDLESRLHKGVPQKADPELSAKTLEELAETRKMLAALEQKQTLQGKALNEKITKSATGMAALSRRLKDTESRQTEISEKVEDAVNQQAKLMRKIDKAIEDRARFMRKIERIEETVVQTRDSLNAKAMVVLTDQAAAGESGSAITHEDLKTKEHQDYNTDDPVVAAMGKGAYAPSYQQDYERDYFPLGTQEQPFWKQSGVIVTAGIFAGILALAVFGGWLFNTVQKQQGQTTETLDEQQLSSAQDWEPVMTSPARDVPNDGLPALQDPQPIEEMAWNVEDLLNPREDTADENNAANESEQASAEEPEAETEQVEASPVTLQEQPQEQETAPQQETQAASAQEDTADDVGAIDLENEEQLIAALEENPQRVAEELNKIEPQRLTEEQEIEEAIAPVTQQAQQPAPTPTRSLRSENQLRNMISADSNLPNAVKSLEDQAFKGIAEAQHDLAAIYTAGHAGVRQDYSRAAFWFERAAESGIANASYNLGVLSHQGLGTKADLNTALKWYTDAAQKGHPEAQYNLGIAYIEGIGVEYNPNRAADYFQRAAEQGIIEAAYNLGLIYENGLLGESRPNDALAWYKQAADGGNPEAKQALRELARAMAVDVDDIGDASTPAPTRLYDSVYESDPVAREQGSTGTDVYVSDQATIAQIQEYLMNAGLYPGPADGTNGALTEDAIRSYQSYHGLNPDGKPSSTLLSHMLANEISSIQVQRP